MSSQVKSMSRPKTWQEDHDELLDTMMRLTGHRLRPIKVPPSDLKSQISKKGQRVKSENVEVWDDAHDDRQAECDVAVRADAS